MPARWPSTRGRLRPRAQRPLPSMITATCRGRRPKSIFSSSVSSRDPGSASLLRSIIESPMLVRNVPKHQTFCRSRPTRFVERRFECPSECCALQFSTPDLDQRAGNPADHVAQEAVSGDTDAHDFTFARHVDRVDRATGRRHLRRDDGKRAKVMLTDEALRRLAYPALIQMLRDVSMRFVSEDV